ncbi:IniB N-terminal domain-containing protein [Umezawaea endophytica]|uniref:IniB N-terminal domain-containing protein n=1 Tax=Umezawaea endophytica TaxID=1654476 RepID=A0A9X3A075_9PSEU|nr:IniB N-terminal domain-containing protein [Umezawaea endophytica]MCS7476683.1 IniB N-terminal domain-containing protein [Umezawaea endophytica]
MDTFETLQDFALNLLNDQQAFSAFQLDPETALGAAGLGDVSALDVQEILPLVLDYAPTQGLGDLDSAFSSLPLLDDSPISGVAGQVQDLTGNLSAVTDLGQGLDADVLGGTLDGVGDLGVQNQVGHLVGDLTSGASVLDTTNLDTTVKDITTGDLSGVTDNAVHLTDVAQVGDLLGEVGNVGDITSGVSGVGDITQVVDLDHVDVGGILSGNDFSF